MICRFRRTSKSLANMDIMQMDRRTSTLLGAGFCTMLTMHFTVQLLSQHLFYWKNAKEQKAIIIIILMAPIYAIDAFAGLVDIEGSKIYFMFLDSIKECYEGLVGSLIHSTSCKPCVYTHTDRPLPEHNRFYPRK